MNVFFKNILIITRPTGIPDGALEQVFQVLEESNIHIFMLKEPHSQDVHYKNCTLITAKEIESHQIGLGLALGGDGTMISAARLCAPKQIPLLGINFGTVGFLTDIALSEVKTALNNVFKGEFSVQNRILLEGSLMRDNKVIARHLAFNDITLARNESATLIKYGLTLNQVAVAQTRADGIIVSTPSGSTAYSLSSGGPILDPETPAILLVPICPQNLSNRPLCVPDTKIIQIDALEGTSGTVHWDGHAKAKVQQGDRLMIRKAIESAALVHPKNYDYYRSLREKLHWNAGGL